MKSSLTEVVKHAASGSRRNAPTLIAIGAIGMAFE